MSTQLPARAPATPDLLEAIGGLLLARVDRRIVTARALMLVESVVREPGGCVETERHTRRLRALLHALGTPAADALAGTLGSRAPLPGKPVAGVPVTGPPEGDAEVVDRVA